MWRSACMALAPRARLVACAKSLDHRQLRLRYRLPPLDRVCCLEDGVDELRSCRLSSWGSDAASPDRWGSRAAVKSCSATHGFASRQPMAISGPSRSSCLQLHHGPGRHHPGLMRLEWRWLYREVPPIREPQIAQQRVGRGKLHDVSRMTRTAQDCAIRTVVFDSGIPLWRKKKTRVNHSGLLGWPWIAIRVFGGAGGN